MSSTKTSAPANGGISSDNPIPQIGEIKAASLDQDGAMSAAKKLNLERASNFMRQYRDPQSRELRKLSANQFMEVWSHYDKDGNGYIEGTELDGFLREFVSSANVTDISPEVSLKKFKPNGNQNMYFFTGCF